MKRIFASILAVITIFVLIGCAKPYALPHDQFCYAVHAAQTVELSAEDKLYMIDVFNEASWTNDLSKCESDFIFYTQKQEIRYHAECGTFQDITNQKSMTVSEEQRAIIHTFLGIH